ncbi:MAG: hypothetical protein KGL39_31925 [Patescibacteria group bacterium]|nr:hypothetical protein [Patescibacteria group bacterium]
MGAEAGERRKVLVLAFSLFNNMEHIISMRPTIGGHVFVCDGLKFDYCFIEATLSMLPVCDEVAVLLFDDADEKELREKIQDPKLKIIRHRRQDWEDTAPQGKYRLSFWTNETKRHLNTEWQFCLQADEVLHENSYELVRQAITEPFEAFVVRRFNLWGDPYHYINYPKIALRGEAGPCGNHTGRLAKIKYDSWNDAENIDAPFTHKYWEDIKTYHMGFVRDRKKMVQNKINMQEKIFQVGKADPKFYKDIEANAGEFDPYTRFSRDELLPITEPLPAVIRDWAKARSYGAVDPFDVKP